MEPLDKFTEESLAYDSGDVEKSESLRKTHTRDRNGSSRVPYYMRLVPPLRMHDPYVPQTAEQLEQAVERSKMVSKELEDMRQEYLRQYGPQDTDLAFLVARMFVRETGQMFRVNLQDCVLFNRTEPVLKLYCTDPQRMIMMQEREKDRLQLSEIQIFLKQRQAFELNFNTKPEEKKRDPLCPLLVQAIRTPSKSTICLLDFRETMVETELITFFNKNRKAPGWLSLQLLVRLMQSPNPAIRSKFDFDKLSKTVDERIIKTAERYVLSFANILPRSLSSYVSESDDLKFMEVR